MPTSAKHVFRFNEFELDTQCGQLRTDGTTLKLQGQPIQILEILLEKPGELVTREELRQRLWSTDTFVDFDHSLNTAIKRLRQALGDDAETPKYIETIPKRGYRFVAQLTQAEPQAQSAPSTITVDQNVEKIAATLADAAITAGKRSDALLVWRVVGIAAIALAALGAALYWITKPPPMPRVVGSHALTNTGFRKRGLATVVSDGTSVYFQEIRPSGSATMQVGVGGGEVSQISVSATDSGSLRAVSQDGSELLLSIFDPEANQYDTWIQPLPTGPPRRIMKNARWAVWGKGDTLYFIRNDKEIYRANADGTGPQRLATLTQVSNLMISPDGRRLRFLVSPGPALWEMSADGANPHPILSKRGGVLAGDWDPDGNFFFFATWGGNHHDLWVARETRRWWEREAVKATQLTFGPVSFNRPTVSKDGRHLYVTGVEHHGQLSVYDDSRKEFVPYLSGLSACYLDFSRDGRWIAYVSFPDGNLWRSRIDGTDRMQLTSPPMAVVNPRWSPDGKLIVFSELSGGDRRQLGEVISIYAVSAEGGQPVLLLAGDPIVADPTWSPDGGAIAYAVGMPPSFVDIRILDLKTQKSTKVPGSESLFSPRWSPDGKYLVATDGSPSRRLMIYSFAAQRWEALVSGAQLGWPNWSRDGKYVVAWDNAQKLIRTTVSSRQTEIVANIGGFRSTAFYLWRPGWFGLTPDGRPITTRDTSVEEIYSLDLEYK